MVRSYKDLDVWKQSVELGKDVYMLVKSFPEEETYVLSDQIRRSAISVASNIAEGSARNVDGTLRNLLDVGKINQLEWGHTKQIEDGIRKTYKWYLRKIENFSYLFVYKTSSIKGEF